MDFWQSIKSGLSNYANFSGRAVRSEFWFWTLFYCLAGTAASIVRPRHRLAGSVRAVLASNARSHACRYVRRLHDLDRSAWWLLLFFVPAANFVLVVWWCMRGTSGYNRFGPDYFRPGGYARGRDQPARKSFTASSRPNT